MKKLIILIIFFLIAQVTLVGGAIYLAQTHQPPPKYNAHDLLEEIARAAPLGGDLAAVDEPISASDSGTIRDPRVANLKVFFRKYNSVLYDEAEFIVQMAEKYGVDYRLIPAIAFIESGLCRVIPENSHNCWGWGIYGGKITRYSSYKESIEVVTKGLKTGYIDRGLVTPEQIVQKYNPSSNGSWERNVRNTYESIDE